MVTARNILLLAAAALLAWWFLAPSEERRVKAVFDRASSLFEKRRAEHVLTAASKARDIAELVSPGARFQVPERHLDFRFDRQALARQIVAMRAQSSQIEVTFEDVAVDFSDPGTAHVTADVLFKGASDIPGFSGRDTRELEATLRKESGEWRFASVCLRQLIGK